jgi:hypothetical protein
MKQTTHFLLALFFVSVSSNVFADSLVINYSNNKRLVKVDGLIPIPVLIVLVVGLL